MRNIYVLLITILFSHACTSDALNEREKLTLVTEDGTKASLEEYEDHYLLVNFWATWCKPCIQELPSLETLQETMKDENVKIILVSNEGHDKTSMFLKSKNISLTSFSMPNSVEEFELLYLPTTILFAPDGSVLFTEEGFREWDDNSQISLIQSKIQK